MDKKEIKLQRLRGSLAFYENLYKILEFINKFGYAKINKKSVNWEKFIKNLNDSGVKEKFDEGDVKSTLRMLGIILEGNLTDFGKELIKKSIEEIKQLLSDKMLKEKEGWAYCHVLSIMSGASREEISELYRELYDEDMQEEYTDISKYNIFLNWLGISEKSKSNSYTFNRENFEKRMGFGLKELESIDRNLKHESKLSLLALIKLDSIENKAYDGKDIRNTVKSIYGDKLNVHHMQHYAKELEKNGFITYLHKGKDGFVRGSIGRWELNRKNPEIVKITSTLLEKFFLMEIDWSLSEIVHKPFGEIIKEMKNKDVHIKGIALEQFASKICWILGLRNIKQRVLEEGVELDVTANNIYPFFNKFLIQCKNHASSVGVPILVKELGIASVEKYDNVMIFSTSGFTSSIRPYVKKAMQSTGINIYLIDNKDMEEISRNNSNVFKIFERENKLIERLREGDEEFWDQFLN